MFLGASACVHALFQKSSNVPKDLPNFMRDHMRLRSTLLN